MGASTTLVLITFVLWWMGLSMAAMVAGGNNPQAFEVITSLVITGISYVNKELAPPTAGAADSTAGAADSSPPSIPFIALHPTRYPAGLTFVSAPVFVPEAVAAATNDSAKIPAANVAMEESGHVRDALALLQADEEQPRLACLISDSTLSAVQNNEAALGQPTLKLQTDRAASFHLFRYDTYDMLHEKRYLPATGLWCVHVKVAGGLLWPGLTSPAALISHGLIVVEGDTNKSRDPDLVHRLRLEVGPASGGGGPSTCGLESTIVTCSACTCWAAPRPPRRFPCCASTSRLSLQLHLFSILCFYFTLCARIVSHSHAYKLSFGQRRPVSLSLSF